MRNALELGPKIERKKRKYRRRKRIGHKLRFVPTDEMRRTVFTMVAAGIAREEICRALVHGGISLATLQRHFREELDTAKPKADASVAKSLFDQAVGTPKRPPNVTAGIWWTKARMGWSERQTLDINQTVTVNKALDYAHLSAEDKRALRDMLERSLAPAIATDAQVIEESGESSDENKSKDAPKPSEER